MVAFGYRLLDLELLLVLRDVRILAGGIRGRGINGQLEPGGEERNKRSRKGGGYDVIGRALGRSWSWRMEVFGLRIISRHHDVPEVGSGCTSS